MREQHLGAADQDRTRELLVDDHLHRAQHALVLALGEHDARLPPSRTLARGREQRLHERAGVIDELLQLLDVGVEVGDRARRDAAFHRGLRHGRRDRTIRRGSNGFGIRYCGPNDRSSPP
jgi:hypothetical protein